MQMRAILHEDYTAYAPLVLVSHEAGRLWTDRQLHAARGCADDKTFSHLGVGYVYQVVIRPTRGA